MNDKALFRRILIATDGSPSSLKAAHLAVELAHTYDARLIALHVVEEALPEDARRSSGQGRDSHDRQSDEGRRYLREVEKIARDRWVKIVSELRYGIPHELLVDLADEEKVDLIVVGKVGRRGARRVLMGSVTQRVIDLAEAPVLTVK